MEVIKVLIMGALLGILLAFGITGTFFFMEATILISSLRDTLKNIGAIAIPIGGSKKPPIAGSNSTPV